MKNNMNADEPKVGWSDYQEITDDTDIELWHEAIQGAVEKVVRSKTSMWNMRSINGIKCQPGD